ncbi:MAG TPA: cupredoxin domain-containing protein [Candidatus Limnocylindrales bacterium]|nr:cupredoxin domain-containing protein [Candidatus Limnocylindrales bacterium]
MRSATATATVTFIALVAAACAAPAAQTWSFAPPVGSGPAASPSDTLLDAAALARVDDGRATSSAAGTPAGATSTTGDGDTAGGPPPAGSPPSLDATAPASAEIEIVDFAFGPATITVATGGRVTWTNRDGERHSILVDGAESPRLESGDTFGRTFASAGTFEYVCGLHPSMTGTIVVAGGGSAAPAVGSGAAGGADAGSASQPSPTGSPEATDDHHDRDDDDRSGHGGGGDDDDDDRSGHGGGSDDD